MLNKKALSFDLCIIGLVLLAHVALIFSINQYSPKPSQHAHNQNIVSVNMMQIQPLEPQHPVETQKLSNKNPHIPDQPQKNAPRTNNPNKTFTAPTKSPIDQLAAKAHEPVQKDQKPTIAKTQEMQTANTTSTSGQSFSATSLSGGDANKTTGTGKDITGTNTQTGATKTGKETTGGDGGGKSQKASIIQKSVNKNYNDSLRDRGIHGTVRLKVAVSSAGRAKNVDVLSSADPALNIPAKRAAMTAKYVPETKAGENVESSIIVNITYRITD